ncbi:unnamed protein product, partial [Ixodes persulcatus]
SSRGTSTPSGAATSLSLSSDDADGSQAYGTTFGLFLGGSSFSSSDGTPLPLLSDVVMARLSDGKEIDELRKKPQTKVAAVATTQVQKWTGGGRVQGGWQVVRS